MQSLIKDAVEGAIKLAVKLLETPEEPSHLIRSTGNQRPWKWLKNFVKVVSPKDS